VCVEMSELCSEKVNSILRNHSKDSFLAFDWNSFKTELSTNEVSLLEACTLTKTLRVNRTVVMG